MVSLILLDFGVTYHTKARYFTLHGIWNIIISFLIIPDMFYTLINPINAIDPGCDYNK